MDLELQYSIVFVCTLTLSSLLFCVCFLTRMLAEYRKQQMKIDLEERESYLQLQRARLRRSEQAIAEREQLILHMEESLHRLDTLVLEEQQRRASILRNEP